MNYLENRYPQKFDLKATLLKAGKSGYWLSKNISRPVSQVYSWLRVENKVQLSNLMQDILIIFFNNEGIEIQWNK